MRINITQTLSCLILGCSFSLNILADSITPEEPEAYTPLELTVLVPNAGMNLRPVYLSIQDNTILIGYVSNLSGFPPPSPFFPLVQEIPGLSPGTYTVKTAYMADVESGPIVIDDTNLSFTIADTFPTRPAYAFFHHIIEHYFVTASDEEADLILDQGWEIVDFGFNVWHADDPAPEAAVPVCRFYSPQVNSHFYTGDAEECSKLQAEDHGWEYEGIAFQALIPVEGACPAGTDPVWRLYNNRFAEMDSNHRFVASSDTYQAMMAQGWAGEGVAFCSPPASSD